MAHVATRCTGGSKRSFDLDFEPMNIEPQSATGAVRGSINEFAGSFFGGGASYREHASFVAQLAGAKVAGRIEAKRKYDSADLQNRMGYLPRAPLTRRPAPQLCRCEGIRRPLEVMADR